MNDFPIITLLTLIPLVSGLILTGLGREQARLARGLALASSLVSLVITLVMWVQFEPASLKMQFAESHLWVPTLAVHYVVGVDGLSMLMLLLTAIVTPMAMLASWRVSERVPLFFALILLLQCGLVGTFTALNFFHWFLFWELSLIPAFFLVKFWGGTNRGEAATQFFIYTMVGSIAMLLSFLALYLVTGEFDFAKLAETGHSGQWAALLDKDLGWYELTARHLALVIFAGAFLGFAVKVPLFPFHTWLPSTYAAAPVGVTMLLTGVMSKMGVYGFARILLPIFGVEMRWVLTALLWLAVATIIFSAAAAFAQRDLRRLLGYSSINHLGYCLLAFFAAARAGLEPGAEAARAAAMNGAFLQMFNHGLTAATLFWFVGMIEERTGGVRDVEAFGGLRKIAPVFCGLMGIALFSSLGLPGLNGFIGEFLIFKGVFALTPWAAGLAVIGLLITAVFILTLIQKVFAGPLNQRWTGFADLTTGERALLALPIALMFVLGIYPQLLLRVTDGTVVQMVKMMGF
jgi:NADH-quinone oxidoreductase subunit M